MIWRRFASILIAVVASTSVALGGEVAGPPLPPRPLVAPITVAQAVEIAANDLEKIEDPFERHCQLYVWWPEASEIKRAALAYAINTGVSHSPNLHKPAVVGEGFVVRINLKAMAPDPDDYRLINDVLEKDLSPKEPYTKVPDLVLGNDGQLRRKVKCPKYVANDGLSYDFEFIHVKPEEQFSLHTGMDSMLRLFALSGERTMPIVRGDWFATVVLSTQLVGRTKGVYYKLQGLDKLNQDKILARLGADADQIAEQKLKSIADVLQQIAQREKFDLFKTTARAGIADSGVTDRPRRVDAFYGTKIRPTKGVQIVTLTHDLSRNNVDVTANPFRSLVVIEDNGREGIGFKENGMCWFWATDNQGVIVESVPENIAHDSTVPHPAPQVLEPAISCIGCHGPADGFIPCRNDVFTATRERLPTMVPNEFEKLDVFADVAIDGLGADEVRETLRALFGADFESVITTAQHAHAAATFELTGFSVPKVTAQIIADRNRYSFEHVDTRRALWEIGFEWKEPAAIEGDDEADTAVKRNEALKEEFFRRVPPLEKNEKGYRAEDPSIGLLRTGLITIPRLEWEHVYADVATRAAAVDERFLRRNVRKFDGERSEK